jgi:hypothetical protein
MYHRAVGQRSGGRAAIGPWAVAVVSLSFVIAAGPARAADAGAPPPALTAEQLADRAYELHAAGRYVESIAMYLKAYAASNASVTLLNVATIYDRKLHERALANDYYRRYVRAPDAEPDLVQKANRRLAALKLEEDAEAARGLDGAAAPGSVDATASRSTDATASHATDANASHSTDATASHASDANASHSTDAMASGSTDATASHATDATVPRSAGATADASASGRTEAGVATPPPRTAIDPAHDTVAPSTGNGWKTTGILLGATGVVGVGTSLVLGLLAKFKNDDANMMCHGSICPSEEGVSLAHQAGDLATASTVTFFTGLALAGAGIGLVVLTPRGPGAPPVRVALAPRIGEASAGLTLVGDFGAP